LFLIFSLLIIKLFVSPKRHFVSSLLTPFIADVVIRRIAYPYFRVCKTSFRYDSTYSRQHDSTTVRQYDSTYFRLRFRNFPLQYRGEKASRHFISEANERLFFHSIITFSRGGRLWLGVASMFDIQRIAQAGNFAA
jgi:hypothetical protein